MKISVAMATYNGATYIREQLASLAGQTRPPDELVVSDDGSDDRTLDIVHAFAATACFPVVVADKTERLGFADNFLHAVAACRHEIVAFCDQDDVWLPRKLELGAECISRDGSLLSMHTLTVTDSVLRPTCFEWDQEIKADKVLEPLELNPFGTGWGNTMMFHRKLAHLIPPADRPAQPYERGRRLSHDTWIYALAAALGRVSQMRMPLILYRQHGATTTIATAPRRRSRMLSAARVPIAEYRERAWFDGEMGCLMERVALQDGPFAKAARLAAARFAERCVLWDARIGVFDGKSLAERRASYHRHQRLAGSQRHWIGSRLKDLVLGVTGATRAAERRSLRERKKTASSVS